MSKDHLFCCLGNTNTNELDWNTHTGTTPFWKNYIYFQPPSEQKINSFKLFWCILLPTKLLSCSFEFWIFFKPKVRKSRHFVIYPKLILIEIFLFYTTYCKEDICMDDHISIKSYYFPRRICILLTLVSLELQITLFYFRLSHYKRTKYNVSRSLIWFIIRRPFKIIKRIYFQAYFINIIESTSNTPKIGIQPSMN